MDKAEKIERMLNDIYSGFPILLTGSGFSTDAQNFDNENLKTGGQLSKWLNDKLKYTKEYPLDIISREYIEKFGELELFNEIKRILSVKSVSDSQIAISSIPWKRMYTTNYDDTLEICASQLRKKYKAINCATNSSTGFDRNSLSILHLNGRLEGTDFRDFEKNIRLTRASYLTDSFLSSSWPGLFRADLTVSTAIIICGYSTYDMDIARILYSDPQFKQKTYFLETVDIDPVFQRELEQFGSVISIPLEEISEKIKYYTPNPKRENNLIAFKKIELPKTASQPSGDDVQSLLLYGNFNAEIELGARLTARRYTSGSGVIEDIMSRIKSGKERNFLIHSDLGNGKTIICEKIALQLTEDRYNCYSLSQYDEYVENDLMSLSERDGVVFFIEDIFRNSKVINKINTICPSAYIVVTTRSSIYELRSHRVSEIFSAPYIEYDINKLSENSIVELTQLIDENGLWADFSKKKDSEKFDFIKRKCNGEIRNVLISLFESPTIKQKIIDTFNMQPDSDALSVLVSALILDVAGFYPDLSLVNQFSGIDVYSKKEKINNTFSLEFINNNRGHIQVKSSVFGEYILQNVVSADYVVDKLIDFVKICEKSRNSTSIFHDIQKEIIRFSFIDRVFKRKKAGDSYKRLYDSIKDLPSMARNPQFWLQYAIARLEDGNYQVSEIHFRTAYSHASKIKGYDTFQIDNHYARYLLESRINDNSAKDDFKSFLEAHNLLVKQARKEKDAYYPYKVARRYYDFYKTRGTNYNQDQINILLHSCEEILSEIAKISKTANKYFVIDECYQDLTSMVSDIKRSSQRR